MGEQQVLTGYIVQIGGKYVDGYNDETGETEFHDDIRLAEIITWLDIPKRMTIEEYARLALEHANPGDLGENREIRIHKCQITIFD